MAKLRMEGGRMVVNDDKQKKATETQVKEPTVIESQHKPQEFNDKQVIGADIQMPEQEADNALNAQDDGLEGNPIEGLDNNINVEDGLTSEELAQLQDEDIQQKQMRERYEKFIAQENAREQYEANLKAIQQQEFEQKQTRNYQAQVQDPQVRVGMAQSQQPIDEDVAYVITCVNGIQQIIVMKESMVKETLDIIYKEVQLGNVIVYGDMLVNSKHIVSITRYIPK